MKKIYGLSQILCCTDTDAGIISEMGRMRPYEKLKKIQNMGTTIYNNNNIYFYIIYIK
jgi:hypothetical protein